MGFNSAFKGLNLFCYYKFENVHDYSFELNYLTFIYQFQHVLSSTQLPVYEGQTKPLFMYLIS